MRGKINLLFLLVLVGCQVSFDLEKEVIGSWKVVEADIQTTQGWVLKESIQEEEENIIGTIYEFNENGTFTVETPSYVDNTGSWELDDLCECIQLNNPSLEKKADIRVELIFPDEKSPQITVVDDNFGTTTLTLAPND